jgi:hypothetical protein
MATVMVTENLFEIRSRYLPSVFAVISFGILSARLSSCFITLTADLDYMFYGRVHKNCQETFTFDIICTYHPHFFLAAR